MKKLALMVAVALLQAGGLWGADFALLNSDVRTVAYFEQAYEPFKCNVGDWNLGTQEYERYYKGWEFVLEELELEGKTYEVIKDIDITPSRLGDFKVLILSNNFWLDGYQTKVVSQWVRRGGKLLATFGTGYAGIEGDFVSGGTNGLHELWGDPSCKVNSSFYLENPWVKVRITRNSGPTQGFSAGDVLDYQYMANLLTKRPLNSRDINGFFVFDFPPYESNADILTRYPAIFNNRHSGGRAVYYAFAPEYLVSLAFDVAGHCANDTRYPAGTEAAGLQAGESPNGFSTLAAGLKPLMRSTLNYLLTQ